MDKAKLQQDTEDLQTIIEVLYQEFEGKGADFAACWDDHFKKWVVYCSDFFIYQSPMYKKCMKLFGESFDGLKFFSVCIHRYSLDILKDRHQPLLIVKK